MGRGRLLTRTEGVSTVAMEAFVNASISPALFGDGSDGAVSVPAGSIPFDLVQATTLTFTGVGTPRTSSLAVAQGGVMLLATIALVLNAASGPSATAFGFPGLTPGNFGAAGTGAANGGNGFNSQSSGATTVSQITTCALVAATPGGIAGAVNTNGGGGSNGQVVTISQGGQGGGGGGGGGGSTTTGGTGGNGSQQVAVAKTAIQSSKVRTNPLTLTVWTNSTAGVITGGAATGGGGGGGGGADGLSPNATAGTLGGTAGAGGGWVYVSAFAISGTGLIQADGGVGAVSASSANAGVGNNGSGGAGGGGGGGGGGLLVVRTRSLGGGVTLSASGGLGAAGATAGAASGTGGVGGTGGTGSPGGAGVITLTVF